jgi:hypothetical protein
MILHSDIDWGCKHLKTFLEMEVLLPKKPGHMAKKLALAVGERVVFLHA